MFSVLLTVHVCSSGCVFFKMDVCCSVENRGFLITYCLSVRYLEVGNRETLLCARPLSFSLSVLLCSLPFVVRSKHLLLFLNSGRCIFHRGLGLHPLASIGQRRWRRDLSTRKIEHVSVSKCLYCIMYYLILLTSFLYL